MVQEVRLLLKGQPDSTSTLMAGIKRTDKPFESDFSVSFGERAVFVSAV